MRKRILAMVLAMVMMLSMASVSFAEPVLPEQVEIEQGSEIMPLYEYTSDYVTSLSISNGKAVCRGYLFGYSGTTTKVVIKVILQKKSLLWWSDVDSTTSTFLNYTGSHSLTKTVGSGTYRTKVVYTVYSGSDSETITDYSGQKTV